MRDVFKFPEFLQYMLDNKLLGNKVKQGFFKKGPKDDKGKKTFLALDPATREYVPQVRKDWPILKELKGIDDPAEKVKTLLTDCTSIRISLRPWMIASWFFAMK